MASFAEKYRTPVGSKPQTEWKGGILPANINPVNPYGALGKYSGLGAVNKFTGGRLVPALTGARMGMMFGPAGAAVGALLGATGIGRSIFGGEDKPSPREMLMYHYGKVGQLRARAEAETNPRKRARFEKKLEANKSQVEKYAFKLDKKVNPKSQFLGPRSFDEIEAGRQKYIEAAKAGPATSTRTILRTL